MLHEICLSKKIQLATWPLYLTMTEIKQQLFYQHVQHMQTITAARSAWRKGTIIVQRHLTR